MTRLYLQVYLGFVVVVVATVFLAGLASQALWGTQPSALESLVQGAATVSRLDPGDPGLEAALEQAAERLDVDVTVWDDHGAMRATTDQDAVGWGEIGPFRENGRSGVRLALPEGGRFALLQRRSGRARGLSWLGLLALGMALGSWPLARRVTRRLEDVQEGVRRWGDGDLSARVPVRGRDEVAAVASAFNAAADRVQRSFEAQRRVLASASHDLRSPLARVRLALELLDDDDPERHALCLDAIRDVHELDRTVGDLLQVGRMQAVSGPERPEAVDLVALVTEEAAHVGAAVTDAGARPVRGDPTLLRRLVRNLLENARDHGSPPLEAVVTETGFEVLDRGPGVPEELRERIFEPFFRPEGHAEGRDGSVGLGLHLCREIAHHHGGTVRSEAREGGGSRFVVRLG